MISETIPSQVRCTMCYGLMDSRYTSVDRKSCSANNIRPLHHFFHSHCFEELSLLSIQNHVDERGNCSLCDRVKILEDTHYRQLYTEASQTNGLGYGHSNDRQMVYLNMTAMIMLGYVQV